MSRRSATTVSLILFTVGTLVFIAFGVGFISWNVATLAGTACYLGAWLVRRIAAVQTQSKHE